MSKSNIVKIMEEKLKKASEAYYNTGSKIMSDEEFDALKDKYENATGEKFEMGASPIASKVIVETEHNYPNLVGTLDKVNTIEEFKEWLKKKTEGYDEYTIQISKKYDGNSVYIEYDANGKAVQAMTRGDSGKGADLTHVFKDHTINNPFGYNVAVKYEVMLSYSDFDKLCEDEGTTYANPRNLISGKLHDKNGYKYYKYMTLVPLEFDSHDNNFDLDRKKRIEVITMSNLVSTGSLFITNGCSLPFTKDNKTNEVNLKLLSEMYKEAADLRLDPNNEYMIDGLVIEITSEEIRNSLGQGSDRPNYAVALKFPYMEKQSKIKAIEFDYGKTGQITPVAIYETVVMNGANYRRTSLASYKRYQELKLGIGSDVLIQLRNEVLCYVESLDTEHNKTVTPVPFIDKCPVCGADIELNENKALAFCSNDECEGKISGRITRFLNKCDVKGVNAKIVDRIIDEHEISTIHELFELTEEQLKFLGDKAGSNVYKALHKLVGKVDDYKILGGIGIKDFGRTSAKELLKTYTIKDLINMLDLKVLSDDDVKDTLMKVEGIAAKTADYILNGLKKYKKELLYLVGLLKPIEYSEQFEISDEVYTFVVTGSLNRGLKRAALKEALEKKGHKVSGTVSSKTNFLVNNDVNSTSSKNMKAKSLNIPIITEDELYDKTGL